MGQWWEGLNEVINGKCLEGCLEGATVYPLTDVHILCEPHLVRSRRAQGSIYGVSYACQVASTHSHHREFTQICGCGSFFDLASKGSAGLVASGLL